MTSAQAQDNSPSQPRLSIISFELKLFAALIGCYFLLRFTAGESWPKPQAVQLVLWVGILKTILLLIISAAILKASQSVTFCAVLILICGAAFLSITGFEYGSKFRSGIYPTLPQQTLFDRADTYWLSAVKKKLRKKIATLDSETGSKQNRLDRLLMIQTGLVQWTERKVGRAKDSSVQRLALESLASQIYPNAFSNEQLEEHFQYIRAEQKETSIALAQKRSSLKESNGLLSKLQKQIGVLAETQSSRQQLSEKTKLAAATTSNITDLTGEIRALNLRIAAIDEFQGRRDDGKYFGGINSAEAIALPVVVPQGNRWAISFFLLTGLHAAYVFAATFLSFATRFKSLGTTKDNAFGNVSPYWHFATCVWMLLFPLLYLF